MIDYLSLAISHGIMLLAAWNLVFRADLDDDDAAPEGANTDIMGRPKPDPRTEAETRA